MAAPNTSASGGYLGPAKAPANLDDDALEDFFGAIIAGLSGLDPSLVRPEWQEEPPTQPNREVAWISFRVSNFGADAFAYERHDPSGNGATEQQRHETIEVFCASYGPSAGANLARVRDGLQVDQNRDALTAAGMGLIDSGEIVNAPVIAKSKWLRRRDMSIRVRRQVRRSYPILNVLSGKVTLDAEAVVEHIIVDA